jgi:anti-sigma factor RsiW
MQHLDEGTIHSWLDGALSADEAAQVEAHVAECPQCAAAVAEARGFIAASSRILTALDHVPRGVVPAAASPARWGSPAVWRAAAAVLVVAVGSLVVFRNNGYEAKSVASTVFDSTRPADAAGTQPRAVALPPEATEMQTGTAPTTSTVSPKRRIAPGGGLSGKPIASAAQPSGAAREQALEGRVAGAAVTENRAPAQAAVAAAPTPQAVAPMRLRGNTAMDAVSEAEPLKVVGTPRRIGARVTLYEVAPGDTVTLMESLSLSLQSVVETGAAAERMAQRATEKSAAVAPTARADTAITGAPETKRATGAAGALGRAPSVPAPVMAVEAVNGVTTITWADATTGNVLKLSGRMPEARLQQIKIRIERERATAAAAAKKNP